MHCYRSFPLFPTLARCWASHQSSPRRLSPPCCDSWLILLGAGGLSCSMRPPVWGGRVQSVAMGWPGALPPLWVHLQPPTPPPALSFPKESVQRFIHVQALTPKANSPMDGHWGGLATNLAQPRSWRCRMESWGPPSSRPGGTNSVSTSSGQWCLPKVPVLLCRKLPRSEMCSWASEAEHIGWQMCSNLETPTLQEKTWNFNHSFGQTQPDFYKLKEPNNWISMRFNPVRAGRKGSWLTSCHNIWTLLSSSENKPCQCKRGWWTWGERGWWDWRSCPVPQECQTRYCSTKEGPWGSLVTSSSQEEVAGGGMSHQ